MPVKDLIQAAKRSAERIVLPAKALADLREVLKANDTEPNRRRRVSAEAFCAYLKKEHDVAVSAQTLKLIIREKLGRTWQT